jgi:hypothetical protein
MVVGQFEKAVWSSDLVCLCGLELANRMIRNNGNVSGMGKRNATLV